MAGIIFFVCLCSRASHAQGIPPNRILQPADSSRMAALRGDIHPLARPQYDQGEVAGGMLLPRITIFFKPSAAQQADLENLLEEQQDPNSSNYHQWLTPEQYGERFGMSPLDLLKVTTWLQEQGFTVIETARSRNWVVFSGTAQQVSTALRTRIHRYAVGGEVHFANASEPFVPAAFSGVVGGFRGLNNFRLQARSIANPGVPVSPQFTSATSGFHYVTPGDFATIYDLNGLYSNGIDGTGQKVAVVGQTDINLSDIASFRAAASLPAKDPQTVLIGPDPGTSTKDIQEASLDVEWAGAVAKNATILYVYSTDVISSMQSAISENLAPVISISYGGCEKNFSPSSVSFLAGLGQQANAQGITIVAAAGDQGATDCDQSAPAKQGLSVDLPAGLPYVTGVGGTQFNEGGGTYWQAATGGQDVVSSALSYIPEIAWNQAPSTGAILATGGGASTNFSKPIWQTGTGVPNDGARDVPDVSFNAAPSPDGYLICSQGWCTNGFRNSGGFLQAIGGTSAGVPTFAGVVALINQQTQSSGQGNINYILYPLAANSPATFHDITSGSNKIACMTGSPDCPTGTATIGFITGSGYDRVTGLGSPDISNLVTEWTSVSSTSLSRSNSGSNADFQIAMSPSKLTVARGTTGTAQITLTALNAFTGTPAFTCSVGTALTGVTCEVVAGGNSNTFVLRVTAPTNSGAQRPDFPAGFEGWPLSLFALAILCTVFVQTRHRYAAPIPGRSRFSFASMLILASVLAIAAGCGGGTGSGSNTNNSSNGSGGTVSAGSVAVTATSGSLSHTAELSVTVN